MSIILQNCGIGGYKSLRPVAKTGLSSAHVNSCQIGTNFPLISENGKTQYLKLAPALYLYFDVK